MDINRIIDYITGLTQTDPVASIAGAFTLVILLFWKPKLFFILLGIIAAAFGVAELFKMLATTGL